jgi:hypothetical protein
MPFNIDNQYQLNWFKPAIYAQTYFDRIFATAGYTYTWDGLAAANFDKLLIPYNGDQNIVDWNDYKVVAEKAGQTFTDTNPGGWQSAFATDLTTGWSETLDPQNLFNTTNGQYTTPQWVGYGSGDSYVYEANFAGSVKIQNVTANNIQSIYLPATALTANITAIYVPFLCVKINNATNVRVYSSQHLEVNYTQANPFPANSFSSTYTFNEIFTFNAAIGQFFPFQGIDVGDIQVVNAGVAIGKLDAQGNRLIFGANDYLAWWNYAGNNYPTNSPSIILDITSINLTIRPSDNIPLVSGITTMNTFVPEKIKQSDFIKSIFMMYNIYATGDPNSVTNLILISRDEYYDAGKAVDWTNKLMKDKEQSMIFIPELSNKKLRLSYKADTDSPNTVYTGITNEIYGQVEITFENEYVKGIDVKELIFSPTPVQATIFGAFLPLLNGAAPKTNIRILYDNGEVTASYVDIISGYDIVTSTGGKYPYLSHFGGPDPFNPVSDINFAVAQYYYYQVAQNTNNNLYNSYWRRTVAQINGGKLLTAYFLLNEVDIQLMELNDKIRIDNSWWSINKIIDYNANDLVPTKVELISLETEIDLPNFG